MECGDSSPLFLPLTRQRLVIRRDESRHWSFYISEPQISLARTPSLAGGKAAPHAIPSELFQPDTETAIHGVARLSVVRRPYDQVTEWFRNIKGVILYVLGRLTVYDGAGRFLNLQ